MNDQKTAAANNCLTLPFSAAIRPSKIQNGYMAAFNKFIDSKANSSESPAANVRLPAAGPSVKNALHKVETNPQPTIRKDTSKAKSLDVVSPPNPGSTTIGLEIQINDSTKGEHTSGTSTAFLQGSPIVRIDQSMAPNAIAMSAQPPPIHPEYDSNSSMQALNSVVQIQIQPNAGYSSQASNEMPQQSINHFNSVPSSQYPQIQSNFEANDPSNGQMIIDYQGDSFLNISHSNVTTSPVVCEQMINWRAGNYITSE